jgi:hypothetical protein
MAANVINNHLIEGEKMKTFRVLFYKSKIGDGHWIDNAISLWTMIFNWRTKNIHTQKFGCRLQMEGSNKTTTIRLEYHLANGLANASPPL